MTSYADTPWPVPVESPARPVVFGAPGCRRDACYVSLSTIARFQITD